jgi:glycosyltransferase involved in cell wall biosynthesis
MHGPAKDGHWLEYLARLAPPDFAICNSHFVSETLRHLYPQTPHAVYYYPVRPPDVNYSPEQRASMRQALGSSPNATVIVVASRLERWKGHRDLLEALARLHDLPDWDCWIIGAPQRVGEEEYFRELCDAANSLGIARRIKFLGQRTEVNNLLGLADIYCQPNTQAEPFGISFVEALHAGLPVVATALGGAIEVVDESCGLLVPPGDISALAHALARLVGDATLRHRLGAAATPQANNISNPRTQIEKLHSLLVRAVSSDSFKSAPNN